MDARARPARSVRLCTKSRTRYGGVSSFDRDTRPRGGLWTRAERLPRVPFNKIDYATAYVAWYDRIAKLMVTQFTNHDTLRLAHASTLVFISKYRESTMLFNDASTRR